MRLTLFAGKDCRLVKIALATWNGRISPVFDVARQVLLIESENGCESMRRCEVLPGTNPSAQAARLKELDPDVLICGAISRPLAALLATMNLQVFGFTAGNVESVLAAWRSDRLPDPAMRMPGCCGRGPLQGRGRRGRRIGCRSQPPYSPK